MTSPCVVHEFKSVPNDKILDLSKLKAAADDYSNLTQVIEYDFNTEENIVRKGKKMLGDQHFLLFQQCFKKICRCR